jgi:hypothetical protein
MQPLFQPSFNTKQLLPKSSRRMRRRLRRRPKSTLPKTQATWSSTRKYYILKMKRPLLLSPSKERIGCNQHTGVLIWRKTLISGVMYQTLTRRLPTEEIFFTPSHRLDVICPSSLEFVWRIETLHIQDYMPNPSPAWLQPCTKNTLEWCMLWVFEYARQWWSKISSFTAFWRSTKSLL